jgi:hypothetical protein
MCNSGGTFVNVHSSVTRRQSMPANWAVLFPRNRPIPLSQFPHVENKAVSHRPEIAIIPLALFNDLKA